MDSSRDLYSFAGDSVSNGECDQRNVCDTKATSERKSASEALRQEVYRRRKSMPPIAPDRHRCESELLESKDGRPIIIEYNDICINSAGRKNPSEGEAERLQSQPGTPIPSPYHIQPDNSNFPYRAEQIYSPQPQPDIIYGAPAPNPPGNCGNFRQTPQRLCNPAYPNRSDIATYPPYINHPNYPDNLNYPALQNCPDSMNYPNPAFPTESYHYSPQPFIPNTNNGKMDQLSSIIREIGPLALGITALSTGRREFHHYSDTYGPPYNHYGWTHNFANTVPIYPYGLPFCRY